MHAFDKFMQSMHLVCAVDDIHLQVVVEKHKLNHGGSLIKTVDSFRMGLQQNVRLVGQDGNFGQDILSRMI